MKLKVKITNGYVINHSIKSFDLFLRYFVSSSKAYLVVISFIESVNDGAVRFSFLNSNGTVKTLNQSNGKNHFSF